MAKRILVIHPDINLAQGVQDVLELEGFIVDVAYELETGMERVWECKPDLIFSKFFEGKQDSRDLLGALCAAPNTERLPVLFLVGGMQYKQIRRELGYGVLHTLPVPITADELIVAINDMLP